MSILGKFSSVISIFYLIIFLFSREFSYKSMTDFLSVFYYFLIFVLFLFILCYFIKLSCMAVFFKNL